jgi:serine phosphatase RsbU (regulator of sigma subunit)
LISPSIEGFAMLEGPQKPKISVNDRFHSLMASSSLPIFVTVFCVVIDTVNSKYKYSNAGHPTPFLILMNPKSKRIRRDDIAIQRIWKDWR